MGHRPGKGSSGVPQVIVTRGALAGLERCRRFLEKAGDRSSAEAKRAISRHFSLLSQTPQIGRPISDDKPLRELLIPFGNSGYVALYRFDPADNTVYILAFRHQREAGY